MEDLHEFKTQLVQFFDELIEQFPDEGDLIIARLFISTQVPIDELIDEFNNNINKNDQKLRKMVKEREEVLFVNHSLFNESKSKLNIFKKIWRSGSLDKDDKDVIWKWVDTFIFLGDRYAHSTSKVLT